MCSIKTYTRLCSVLHRARSLQPNRAVACCCGAAPQLNEARVRGARRGHPDVPNPLHGDVVSFLRADLEWDIHEQSSSSSSPRLVEQLEQTADALEAQQASTMKHAVEIKNAA